jgi:N12 class adenine-specific DNA methylase
MNIFASFARNIKLVLSRFAHVQEIGSDFPTLTLIPNSLLHQQSSTHRKVYPTKRATDKKSEFVYTNSMNTDISKTFQKFKQE